MSEPYAFFLVLGDNNYQSERFCRERDARDRAEQRAREEGGRYFVMKSEAVFEREVTVRVHSDSLYLNWDEVKRLNAAERARDDEFETLPEAPPSIAAE